MKSLVDIQHDYLRHLETRNFSALTIRCRRGHLRHFLDWLAAKRGVRLPGELAVDHLDAYLRVLAGITNARGLPIRPGSRNNRIKAVRGFLAFLFSRSHISHDLGARVHYAREPRRLPGSLLDHEEMRTLLDAVPTDTPTLFRNRTILELLYTAGIRRAELVGLNLDDVDLRRGCAKVLGKGAKERVVPVGATALRWLESYLRGVRPFWKAAGEHTAVFLSCRGNPLSAEGLRYIVNAHFHDASVRVTPHTFRRSCTTEMIRAEANLYHVKEMLGHESLETLRPYTRLTITDLKRTHARCHPRERDQS
jgi:integrase/recombinase XerD